MILTVLINNVLHRRGAWQRLEKVVVLELTVSHLRRLAAHHPGECFAANSEYYSVVRYNEHVSFGQEREGVSGVSSSTGDGRQQFREGYQRCQEEVLKFLGRIAAVQPHAAARLRQQLVLTTVGAAGQNAHPPADLDNVPAVGELRCAPNDGTDPPHITAGEKQPQPDPVNLKIPVPRRPCGLDPAQPHHAPYAHTHWKKCLRPGAGTCFWRPW